MPTIKKISNGGNYIPPALKLKHIEENITKLNNLIKNLGINNEYLEKTGFHKNYLNITKNKLKEGLENLKKVKEITKKDVGKHIEDGQKSRGTYNYEKNRKKANIESNIAEINRKLESINDAIEYDKRMLEFLTEHLSVETKKYGTFEYGQSRDKRDLITKYENMLDAGKTKNKRTREAILKYHKNAAEFRKIYTVEKTNKEIKDYETKINSKYSYDNKELTIYELYKIIYENKLEELKFELKKLSGNLNNLIPPNKKNLPEPIYTLFGVSKDSNLSGGKKKPVTKKPVTKKPVTKKPATKKSVTKKPATKKPVKKETSKKKPANKKPSSKKPVKKSSKK